MKISVITVCFNSATTIVDTLRSVAQQTYPNVEHVIIDGGSRDKTVELANSLIRSGGIVRSESDKGIYDAMNKGLRLATGDIIGFLNADDVYADNDLLRRVVEMMEQTSLDALFGDVEFFKSEAPEKAHRRYRSNRFRPDRIGWGWMPAHPTLFLRRRVFDEFGCFRENYKIAGDFELIARIFKSNTLVYRYVPQVLVRMRIGGVSTGGWRNTIRLNKEVLRACRENGISSNWMKLLSKYPAKLFEFFLK
ncbi:MAG: glycosyltransferase [Burkholderiales bacterium]|jgi:glycosyltransferase involved in cell wall biosynthesis|nr:glycosyltransferase [Burkholderiales bacterium]MBK9348265.1 glycosyltransferase [Burkholderiales bacterium]